MLEWSYPREPVAVGVRAVTVSDVLRRVQALQSSLRIAVTGRRPWEVMLLERLRLREGWSSLVLLLLLLLTVARAFEVGGLAEGLHILPAVVTLGALTGLILAKVRLPALLAHLLGLVAGIVACYLLLGTVVELPPTATSAGWLAVQQMKAEVIAARLQTWFGAALHGDLSSDAFPFVVQMTGIAWLMAFYGAWSLFHRHWVWGAIVPPGLAVFLGVYYAPPGLTTYFVYYLLWSLILIVRSNVYGREREWQSHQVLYEPYIGLGFLRDGALIALAVVGLVWVLPHPNPPARLNEPARALEAPWQRVQDEWARLYASLAYRDQQAVGAFGRSLSLGGAISLGTTPVLEVQAPEDYYWRAVVLDRYTGSGWMDTSPVRLRRSANEPLLEPDALVARTLITQTVTCLRPGEPLLFAAAEPLRLSVRVDAQALLNPSGGAEVSCVSPAQSLGREQRYAVASLVSTASVRALSQAGADYPVWLAERYLQLPPDLPERISDLAREVTANAPTPYDKAVAIETYLRQMRYNQAIETPPADRDPVDWFLFDYREGYCTYFASAMALMCRAVGVPTRLAQGYAPGEFSESHRAYVIRDSDAHAWPEVYFPGYGWAEFEPTPSRPLIQRPTGDEAAPGDATEPGELQPGGGPDSRRPQRDPEDIEVELGPPGSPLPLAQRLPWRDIGLALGVVALLGVAFWRHGRRWLALRPSERLYVRLGWIARPLGVRVDPCQTPSEFALALDGALEADRPLAQEIVGLYLRERYAGRGASARELAQGNSAWWRALLAALPRAVGRLLRRS